MSELSNADTTARPRHVQLRFTLSSLDRLPELRIPERYGLRHYESGDEEGWAAVLRASFNDEGWTPDKIRREFLDHDYFQPERISLATGEGRIVGAAGAWSRGNPEEGYVHWVGVDPEHQGKKLGRLVTLATLYRFREEGMKRAILDTDEFRVAACATYLSLGFLPLLDSPERESMWANVKSSLGLTAP
jgi:mycothiol synthase